MDVLKSLYEIGIVPVVVLDDASKAVPLAKALLKGGLPCAEVTFRTAAAEEAIAKISKEVPDVLVGAGTVLNVEQGERAIKAGAKFIVSPGFNDELVKWCIDKNIPCMPGCANPSEMTKAYNLGLKVAKIFPAENIGGIKYITAVGAALPLKFMPTGGINTKNLVEYATSDKILACGGTWMVKKDLIEAEKWDEIENICKDAVKNLLGFQIKHVGINFNSEADAGNIANLLASMFKQNTKVGKTSTFMGTMVECCHKKYPGENGHIAIGVNNVDRAIYHMKSWGIEFDDSSLKVDEKTGRAKAIYLKNEIANFAFHLMQN